MSSKKTVLVFFLLLGLIFLVWLGKYRGGQDNFAENTQISEVSTRSRTVSPNPEKLDSLSESTDTREALSSESSEFPKEAMLTFLDGTKIPVKFELSEWFSVPKPRKGELEFFYGDLIAAVDGGNGTAAFALAGLARDCQYISRNKIEHNKSLDDFRTTGKYYVDEEEFIQVEVGSHNYDMMNKSYEGLYSFCKNVPPQEADRISYWHQKSLELKSPVAIKKLASSLVGDRPHEAYNLFRDLWQEGHAEVANDLAYMHSDELAPPNEKQNQLMAYAFQLVSTIISEADYVTNGSDDPNAANRMADMDRSLRATGSNLTPAEQLEAEKYAKQLILESPKCCIGHWTKLME